MTAVDELAGNAVEAFAAGQPTARPAGLVLLPNGGTLQQAIEHVSNGLAAALQYRRQYLQPSHLWSSDVDAYVTCLFFLGVGSHEEIKAAGVDAARRAELGATMREAGKVTDGARHAITAATR